MLRVDPGVHAAALKAAARSGVSLNKWAEQVLRAASRKGLPSGAMRSRAGACPDGMVAARCRSPKGSRCCIATEWLLYITPPPRRGRDVLLKRLRAILAGPLMRLSRPIDADSEAQYDFAKSNRFTGMATCEVPLCQRPEGVAKAAGIRVGESS